MEEITPVVPPPMIVMPGERFAVLLTRRAVPPVVREPAEVKVPAVSVVVPLPSQVIVGSIREEVPPARLTRIPTARPVTSNTARDVAPPESAPAAKPMLMLPVEIEPPLLAMEVFESMAPKVRVDVAPEFNRLTLLEIVTVPPFTLLTTVPIGTPYPVTDMPGKIPVAPEADAVPMLMTFAPPVRGTPE